MASDLKIFGCNIDRNTRCVVAAKTATEAASLMGVSLNYLNANGGETWNQSEANAALSSPRTVFAAAPGSSSFLPRAAHDAKVAADAKAHYDTVVKGGRR